MGTQSTFTEDLQDAKRLADVACAEMVRHAVPPTPANFCVWYSYARKTLAGLNREIDTRIAEKKGFSWQANQELFEKYFGTETETATLRQAGSELTATMGHVLSRLDKAGAEASAFGETLALAGGSLAKIAVPETSGVHAVVRRLSGATREMVSKSRDLEAELRESTDQIRALQDRLEKARLEALTDGLTGIGNRRCFDLALAEHGARAMTGEAVLCLILIDIDHFKRFNDVYGHRIGDQVLKVVGMKLKEIARPEDTPARYGGEEFALLTLNTTFKSAMERADSLRNALASNVLRNKQTGDVYGQVTASMGVSCFRPTDSLESFVHRADAALYQAKREGRNRVISEAA
ncbi:MAG TPA: GGDEF domain-containing protein [Dongiaceae bacterium]